ncbi:hypothetical protein ACK1U3_18380 [Pseudomonas promysalinigenes]|uniref:hypothetical protein n=1 Tax=Pseudomonas promysalinigenes TaxID=485898 RepID=UPI003916CE38
MGSFMVGKEHCPSRAAQWRGLMLSWLAVGAIAVCIAVCVLFFLSGKLGIDILLYGFSACSAGLGFLGRMCAKARGRLFQGHYLELSRPIVVTELVSNSLAGLCVFIVFMVQIYLLFAVQ